MSGPMRVLGLISGTSHDGIDAALVEFSFADGVLRGAVRHASVTPYPSAVRARLAAALPPATTTLSEMCQLDTLIGQAFADVARRVIDDSGAVDVVVSHGQTVFHWVEDAHCLGTLQIGQPAWIAERTGAAVVSDVRIRDITAGGHGAPLVSFLDTLLLAGLTSGAGAVGALNLGGIANMTLVRASADPYAFDIGPANALVDAVIARSGVNDLGYDDGGRLAAVGTTHEELLTVLLDDPYYALDPPKSTGKEHFHGGYVDAATTRAGFEVGVHLSLDDLVATLTELTVRTVAQAVRAAAIATVVVSGGGCRNPVMMGGLQRALPGVRLMRSDDLGAPADEKEAIAFALIGWCTMHGLAANEPAATGADGRRVLGTITPGRTPLVLPEPIATPIAALELFLELDRAGDR